MLVRKSKLASFQKYLKTKYVYLLSGHPVHSVQCRMYLYIVRRVNNIKKICKKKSERSKKIASHAIILSYKNHTSGSRIHSYVQYRYVQRMNYRFEFCTGCSAVCIDGRGIETFE